jgi:hypothetical protein
LEEFHEKTSEESEKVYQEERKMTRKEGAWRRKSFELDVPGKLGRRRTLRTSL